MTRKASDCFKWSMRQKAIKVHLVSCSARGRTGWHDPTPSRGSEHQHPVKNTLLLTCGKVPQDEASSFPSGIATVPYRQLTNILFLPLGVATIIILMILLNMIIHCLCALSYQKVDIWLLICTMILEHTEHMKVR